jgi:hypothetical protein
MGKRGERGEGKERRKKERERDRLIRCCTGTRRVLDKEKGEGENEWRENEYRISKAI